MSRALRPPCPPVRYRPAGLVRSGGRRGAFFRPLRVLPAPRCPMGRGGGPALGGDGAPVGAYSMRLSAIKLPPPVPPAEAVRRRASPPRPWRRPVWPSAPARFMPPSSSGGTGSRLAVAALLAAPAACSGAVRPAAPAGGGAGWPPSGAACRGLGGTKTFSPSALACPPVAGLRSARCRAPPGWPWTKGRLAVCGGLRLGVGPALGGGGVPVNGHKK